MSYEKSPDRVLLVNMVTGDSRSVQYNPEQLEEQIGVSYADLQVVGLSHKRSHFINTDNVAFNFDLYYRAIGGNAADLQAIKDDRKFLYALTHPWRAEGINRGGPPRVLFIWPELISLTCKVKSLGFTYTQFNLSGAPTAYKVKVVLEEVRDVFVGMDDILARGTQRDPGDHA